MRIAEKRGDDQQLHILVLGVFQKEAALRNQLKSINNKNILPSISAKKM